LAILQRFILANSLSLSYSHFFGPSGTWGFPNKEDKEVKSVKQTVNFPPLKDLHDNQCGPWGVHSVHELEDIMGIE
jgi:hypothetical protein